MSPLLALIVIAATPQDGISKQNAVYMRPFITQQSHIAIGGYTEANVNAARTDGIGEGTSFEFQRFNLFVYSPINKMVRLLAELEFEHGTSEINLETALVDVSIAPELTLRAGIILTPIGAFNQAHDGPLWDFVQRPLVSTTIIPSTFSEVGGGIHGTFLLGPVDLDYQLYATQGLGEGIIDNPLGRTDISAGKSQALFGADNNGSPAFSGRLGLRYDTIAELGVSAYHGAYNRPTIEGIRVDERRDLTLAALDYRFTSRWVEVRGEAVYASIELPRQVASTFGSRQWGFFVDTVVPVLRFEALRFEETKIEVGARVEHVDYNASRLDSVSGSVGDELTRVTALAAWRLSASTVIRLNGGYDWASDRFRSATSRTARVAFGFATYF